MISDIIRYDLTALTGKEYSFLYCLYYIFKHRGFRLVFYLRKCQERNVFRPLWRFLYRLHSHHLLIEISPTTHIGRGLTLGHPSCIVINSRAVLGDDISISHGVTIGLVRSGKRQGVPTIGSHIFIGANSAIVGG